MVILENYSYPCLKLRWLILIVCILRHQRHDYANYDQFAQNFGTAYKTIQCVSVPNLKLFGSIKRKLWVKEVRKFSIMFYGKMGWQGFSCPSTWLPQYKCVEISKLWAATGILLHLLESKHETCRDSSKWGCLHHVKVLSEKTLIEIFDDVIANQKFMEKESLKRNGSCTLKEVVMLLLGWDWGLYKEFFSDIQGIHVLVDQMQWEQNISDMNQPSAKDFTAYQSW